MSNVLITLIVIAVGGFSLAGSLQNWDWFFNNRRARIMVSILGRNGARIFYGILGSALILGGLVLGVGLLFSK